MTISASTGVAMFGVLGGGAGALYGAKYKHPVAGGLAGAALGTLGGVLLERSIEKDVAAAFGHTASEPLRFP